MSTEVIPGQALNIAVDPEHGALRFLMVILFIILLVVSYLVINLVLPSDGVNILAVIGALALTFFLSQQIENQMKARWPSGRTVQIDEEGVRVLSKGRVQTNIDGHHQVNVLMWRFKIQRRARVPKGWFVMACALEQENDYLPVYTFMSPDQAEKIPMADHFKQLMSKKDVKAQGMERDMRLAGQQRRLYTAEQVRWMSGAEMTPADFEAFIVQLQVLYPKWMPSS